MPRRGDWRRIRAELRRQLTPGERGFWYGMATLTVVLPPAAIVLVAVGPRVLGIALLLCSLVVFAIPVTPILRARVRRREARERRKT